MNKKINGKSIVSFIILIIIFISNNTNINARIVNNEGNTRIISIPEGYAIEFTEFSYIFYDSNDFILKEQFEPFTVQIVSDEEMPYISFEEVLQLLIDYGIEKGYAIAIANEFIFQREIYFSDGKIYSNNLYSNDLYFRELHSPHGYQFIRWIQSPRIVRSDRIVRFATLWIGIDAFRSAAGITAGTSRSITISANIGFTGSLRIRDFNANLNASASISQTSQFNASATAPGWTTVNWRPYIAFYRDIWEATSLERRMITAIPLQFGYNTFNHQGENTRLRVRSNEVWSRENISRNINAATPLPPNGPPLIRW